MTAAEWGMAQGLGACWARWARGSRWARVLGQVACGWDLALWELAQWGQVACPLAMQQGPTPMPASTVVPRTIWPGAAHTQRTLLRNATTAGRWATGRRTAPSHPASRRHHPCSGEGQAGDLVQVRGSGVLAARAASGLLSGSVCSGRCNHAALCHPAAAFCRSTVAISIKPTGPVRPGKHAAAALTHFQVTHTNLGTSTGFCVHSFFPLNWPV